MITLPPVKPPRRRRGAVRPQQHHGGPGPRPFTWRTGPDPVLHSKYVAWSRARAQALFRQEGWNLTFEEFEQIWGDQWHRRGRARDDLCMTRTDPDLAWDTHNVELVTRAEHNRRCAARKMALK